MCTERLNLYRLDKLEAWKPQSPTDRRISAELFVYWGAPYPLWQ